MAAQKALIETVPNQPYQKYELKKGRDTVTYYLSVTSQKEKLPLLVYIQGSSINSHFAQKNNKIVPTSGHDAFEEVTRNKYRILIIEKPGVNYLQKGASSSFDQKFSLENWSKNIVTAIDNVMKNEKIDPEKVMLVGHSEGGVVAARVAKLLRNKVSHVTIMAGEGPSQLYSLYKFAEEGIFFNTKEHNMPTVAERINYVYGKWNDILADPTSTEKKFWGFTYLRWSSLAGTSVIEELSDFHGRILLLQGTADKSVYPESAVIAYNSLRSKGRKVELLQINNADHSFNIKNQPEVDGWKMAIEKIISWSETSN